jgi:hypothetical protein
MRADEAFNVCSLAATVSASAMKPPPDICQSEDENNMRGLISIWLYKENNKLRD